MRLTIINIVSPYYWSNLWGKETFCSKRTRKGLFPRLESAHILSSISKVNKREIKLVASLFIAKKIKG